MKSFAQRGFATMQMLIVGAIVLSGAAYVMKMRGDFKKFDISMGSRKQFDILKREIVEAISQSRSCISTLSRMGKLTAEGELDGIYNGNGLPLYQVGKTYYGKKIEGIRIEGYKVAEDSKPISQLISLAVDIENIEKGKITGAPRLTQRIKILVTTQNNELIGCRQDDNGFNTAALKLTCESLGGIYNKVTDRCENMHGAKGFYLKQMKEKLCLGDKPCEHPLKGKECRGVDNRGANWDNHVLTGLSIDGSLSCTCIPVRCPDPATVCLNQDTGTDHCMSDCPRGTKTDDYCQGGCNADAWTPEVDLSRVCSSVTVVQRNACHVLRYQAGRLDCTQSVIR